MVPGWRSDARCMPEVRAMSWRRYLSSVGTRTVLQKQSILSVPSPARHCKKAAPRHIDVDYAQSNSTNNPHKKDT